MNKALSLGAVLLSLAALLVATRGAFSPEEASPPRSAAREEGAPGETRAELEALERRVRALEVGLQGVSRRLMALERAPDAGVGPGASPESPAQEVRQLREDVQGLRAGGALPLDSPQERTSLKELVREAQAELLAERRQARAEERRAQQEQRWRRFVEEARPTWSQEQDVKRLLETEEAQRQALRAQGLSSRDRRRELRALRERTDAQARKRLDEEQYARYLELLRSRRSGSQQGRRSEENRR